MSTRGMKRDRDESENGALMSISAITRDNTFSLRNKKQSKRKKKHIYICLFNLQIKHR